MRILLLGGGGMLGSTLAPYLKTLGWDVVVHSKKSNADVNFDASHKDELLENLNKINPDVIVNLIALTSVEKCEAFPNEGYILNAHIPYLLGDWVKKESCHLVQVSTDHVYDALSPNKEADVVIRNYYALTKLAGELACASEYTTILRTNFVGRSNAEQRESLSDWVYNSLQNKLQVEILSDVYFSPLSMKILCEVISVVIENNDKKGCYNVGSKGGVSKANFDLMLGRAWGFDCSNMALIESKNAGFLKADRPKGMEMDSSRFEADFGFKLPTINEVISSVAEEYVVDERD